MTATRQRPTARPDPFRVCTYSFFLEPAGANRMFARRPWKSSQLEQEEISRYLSWPGNQTSMS